ncbi:acyl-homoserine lactone acylase PvdQ [Pseudomonas sp. Pc102]|nr:acyl-homoserine lactone acylase PvdQ [Pseudomonas sp. Pc102]
MPMRSLAAGVAALLLCPAFSVLAAAPAATPRDTLIRWTAHGVPHIQAADERGLGYGIGYAYARDNACLLAEEIVTARGERSRWFGEQGQSSAHLDNLPSDFFFAWLNQPASVAAFRQAQTREVAQLLDGYAAGFNHYLQEADARTTPCLGEGWLRPIDADDLLRLTRRLLVEGGAGQFAEALIGAAPPGVRQARLDAGYTAARTEGFRLERGSNAVAVGGKRSANGRGMLLANPHFPWSGALRFWQLHLTIPGKLDVMGAALPGLPVVNIGFGRQLAWTHTVDTSAHFTLYRLELDPGDPTRYRVDGRTETLNKTRLQVQVRNADGTLSVRSHDLYESRFGPLLDWPGKLEWTAGEAWALKDANLGNTRVLQQWYAINQARDLDALRAAVTKIQGIPWVNTLAADASGKALYMNQSVVPHLLPGQLAECVIPQLAAEGLPALQGNRSACEWTPDAGAAQPGITPAAQLPVLQREDFVQNSNDSAWLSNPASPLAGYSPLVSREGRELSPRARFALGRLQGDALLGADVLQALVTDNEVGLATGLLPELLALCKAEAGNAGLAAPCKALAAWDGKANLESGIGFLHFQHFMQAFAGIGNGWREPFDPQRPTVTPRGLNPAARGEVIQALVAAGEEVARAGIPEEARWGDIQRAGAIGVPGGDGHFGVYNAMQSELQGDHLEVVSGTSYLQLVTFDDNGPQARGLLAFSQSSEAGSPHHSDQTELFARQQWQKLPFTNAEIEADPELERKVLEVK